MSMSIVFGLTIAEIEDEFTVSGADALSTRPLIAGTSPLVIAFSISLNRTNESLPSAKTNAYTMLISPVLLRKSN